MNLDQFAAFLDQHRRRLQLNPTPPDAFSPVTPEYVGELYRRAGIEGLRFFVAAFDTVAQLDLGPEEEPCPTK